MVGKSFSPSRLHSALRVSVTEALPHPHWCNTSWGGGMLKQKDKIILVHFLSTQFVMKKEMCVPQRND